MARLDLGVCEYCRAGRENLRDRARFTGYQIDGGYAELTVADQRFCFAIGAGRRPAVQIVRQCPRRCGASPFGGGLW